jgi:hypothetical protein
MIIVANTTRSDKMSDDRPHWDVHAQLKIVTWANEELASDALSIRGYEHYQAPDYAIAAWYPPRPPRAPAAAAPDQATQPSPSGRSAEVTRWWAEGDEPLYYIVSSKASVALHGRALSCKCCIDCCLLHLEACLLPCPFAHAAQTFSGNGEAHTCVTRAPDVGQALVSCGRQ